LVISRAKLADAALISAGLGIFAGGLTLGAIMLGRVRATCSGHEYSARVNSCGADNKKAPQAVLF
jgi:hypothetical protein